MAKKSQSILSAASIIAIGKYSNLLFGILANAILARLLNAEEYGIVAILTVFVTFFQMFTDMGFGAAVIQNKELNKSDVNNIYSLTIYLGIFLMFVFFVASDFIALFYDNVALKGAGKLISISLLLNTWNMIPNALLLKQKRFKEVGIRTIVVSGSSYAVAIVMAIMGASYYSLVIQSVCLALFTFLWNYLSTKPLFAFKPEKNSIKKVLGFSMSSFGYDIVNYFSRNLDNLLTGRIMGATQLGYYNKAYQLTTYPNTYFTSIISSVLHPILSEYQNQLDIIYKKYMEILKLLTLVSAFVSVLFCTCAEEIIIILYGETWISIVTCFRILSISVFWQMITSSTTNVFRSMNRTDLRLKSGLLYVPVQVVMIIIGTLSKNIEVLAAFVTVSFIFRYIFEFYILIKAGFKKSMKDFYINNIPLYFIYVFCLASMYFVSSFINFGNAFFSLLVKFFICTFIYFIFVVLFKQTYIIAGIIPEKLIQRVKGILKSR